MRIHSIITILAAIVVTPPCALLAVGWSIFDRTGNGPHKVARFWARFLLRVSRIRVRISGLSNLNPQGTYVLAANHTSLFDIPVLLANIPLQFRWLAKAELFRIPLFGRAMLSCGYVPISRTSPRDWVRSLNGAARRIKAGASVIIFPEGTRSRDGRIQKFKRGGFELAVRSGQPLVPVSLSGVSRILPAKTLRLQPGPVQVVVGSPIPTAGLNRSQQEQLMEQVRQTIMANYDPDYGAKSNP